MGILTYDFDWLFFTHCLTSFFSINHLHLYAVFGSISSNTDKVLSANPFANVFVCGRDLSKQFC